MEDKTGFERLRLGKILRDSKNVNPNPKARYMKISEYAATDKAPATFRISFSKAIVALMKEKECYNLDINRNKLTQDVFIMFTQDEDGLELKMSGKNSAVCNIKKAVQMVMEVCNCNSNTLVELSENLAQVKEALVFKMIKKEPIMP